MRSKKLSSSQKEILEALLNQQIPYPKIAQELGISLSCIKMYVLRKRELAELGHAPKVRKRITDNGVGSSIRSVVIENPKTPYRAIPGLLQELHPQLSAIPAARTCLQYLHNCGFKKTT